MADNNTNATFGNALTNANGAIPIIFSKKLAVAYGTKGMGVTDNLTNDNYAGEIKEAGDRVRIVVPVIPPDNAIAFGSNAEVCPTFQSPSPEALDLVIDRVATFGLTIDDVQKAQTQFKQWLDGQATAYGEKLKFLKNKEIAQYAFMAAAPAGHSFADGGNGGSLNTPLTTINSQNIFIHLLKVKEAFPNFLVSTVCGNLTSSGILALAPILRYILYLSLWANDVEITNLSITTLLPLRIGIRALVSITPYFFLPIGSFINSTYKLLIASYSEKIFCLNLIIIPYNN